jgi:ketosteroid isomerase-like protein
MSPDRDSVPLTVTCHSLNQLGGALWFRSTLGLRKIGGRWQITHEHNSTPFYMDGSDRAALDLQP